MPPKPHFYFKEPELIFLLRFESNDTDNVNLCQVKSLDLISIKSLKPKSYTFDLGLSASPIAGILNVPSYPVNKLLVRLSFG